MRASQMDQPTPREKDTSVNWPGFMFLSVAVLAAAAVCIVGMIKFL